MMKDVDRMLCVEMDPLGEDTWKLEPVIELIKDGGVGVIPTDTVYDLSSQHCLISIERKQNIKQLHEEKC